MEPGRILLVDDDREVIRLLGRYLGRFGRPVDACGTGGEACARIESAAQYAVAVIDLTLPDMSGDEVAVRLLAVNPAAHVVIVSGYPFEAGDLEERCQHPVQVLQKPFLPKALGEVITPFL
jgi:CheY-like chemotaxis protein